MFFACICRYVYKKNTNVDWVLSCILNGLLRWRFLFFYFIWCAPLSLYTYTSLSTGCVHIMLFYIYATYCIAKSSKYQIFLSSSHDQCIYELQQCTRCARYWKFSLIEINKTVQILFSYVHTQSRTIYIHIYTISNKSYIFCNITCYKLFSILNKNNIFVMHWNNKWNCDCSIDRYIIKNKNISTRYINT